MQVPLRQSLIDACLIGPESPAARKDQRYALEGRTLGSQVSFSPRRSVIGHDEVHNVGVVGDGCPGAIGEALPCGHAGSLPCMEGGRDGIFPSWARQRRGSRGRNSLGSLLASTSASTLPKVGSNRSRRDESLVCSCGDCPPPVAARALLEKCSVTVGKESCLNIALQHVLVIYP